MPKLIKNKKEADKSTSLSLKNNIKNHCCPIKKEAKLMAS
jgi:hypothetical protein